MRVLLAIAFAVAAGTANAATIRSLRLCADPGNMPLSNQQGEGFQNKIGEVLGRRLNASIDYYWRPSIERGLMRTTLSDGNCDVWLDMASDTEGAAVTKPLYRSAFVLVYREDKGYGSFKSLDDPRLRKARIGVFQVSAIRQALLQHGVQDNTVIHYLTHDGDIVAENQPSYQVQQVIDGKLDIAAAWGPMAGYYRTIKKAPIVVQPVNLIDDTVPLEFNMALAVPRGRPEVKEAVERGLTEGRDEIHKILDDYGVPLVKCDECIVSGNLPSHGPYRELPAGGNATAAAEAPKPASQLPRLKKAIKEGADPLEELSNAIVADDAERVTWLLKRGVDVNERFGEGHTALTNATRFGFTDLIPLLLEHKADVNGTDLDHWTPLMYAAWTDDEATIKLFVARGAALEAGDADGMTALGIAAQNDKRKALAALLDAGADVNKPVGKGGYTPLMLAAMSGNERVAEQLIRRGADVNARNAGGITPLMVVAANDAVQVGTLLLKSGADPKATSEDGRTATTIARANNSGAMLALLTSGDKPG